MLALLLSRAGQVGVCGSDLVEGNGGRCCRPRLWPPGLLKLATLTLSFLLSSFINSVECVAKKQRARCKEGGNYELGSFRTFASSVGASSFAIGKALPFAEQSTESCSKARKNQQLQESEFEAGTHVYRLR